MIPYGEFSRVNRRLSAQMGITLLAIRTAAKNRFQLEQIVEDFCCVLVAYLLPLSQPASYHDRSNGYGNPVTNNIS